jgi:hypothetical protein
VIERFVRRARTPCVRSRRVKSIVDPNAPKRCGPIGPHLFAYQDGTLAREYVTLKRRLASRFANDREAYTEAKRQFIHTDSDRPGIRSTSFAGHGVEV